MRKTRVLTIRGEKWKIKIARPPENFCQALCVFDERTIYIRPTSEPIPCIIHEILHACLPDFSERAIEEIEEAIVTGLELQ